MSKKIEDLNLFNRNGFLIETREKLKEKKRKEKKKEKALLFEKVHINSLLITTNPFTLNADPFRFNFRVF